MLSVPPLAVDYMYLFAVVPQSLVAAIPSLKQSGRGHVEFTLVDSKNL